jgi:uncharacterized membrane protein
MKKTLVVLLAFSLLSCEQIEKIDAQMDADSTDIANELAEMSGTLGVVERLTHESEVLFQAVGSEPGWYAEFHTDKFRMLMNYGKDSIVLFREFSKGGDLNFTYNNTEDGQNIKMKVQVENKECTDAAGGKNPNTVTVTFNEQTFTGCGKPAKK